jgi:hypothetical protein
MDNFLNVYDLPKLNQENTNKLNISITSNEIEAEIKSLQRALKSPSQNLMDSLMSSIRPLRTTDINVPQTIPQNAKGSNTSKLIL